MPSHHIRWTNKSVLAFAGDTDPISLIEIKARELALRARDAGWAGPPYNPLAIADLLNIAVEAINDVADARTIVVNGKPKIQFNPTKPRERVRFSIAHEIAHTLFPDVGEKPRHRDASKASGDEWQLEMLCNLAAAEFVMPVGSLPSSKQLPKIESLMTERRRFDVSAEAFLIRAVKTTEEPALMFCASPVEHKGERPGFRVDYSVGSKSAPAVVAAGALIPDDSVVYSCTAIGQTNRAAEAWATDKKLMIECVGIPGFPGTAYPRVAGVIRFRGQDARLDVLNFVQGNVLNPVAKGPKIICQLVNDQARVWGGGVARSTAKKYPKAQQQFSEWFLRTSRPERLGRVHFGEAEPEIVVASLIAQQGYGESSSPRIRYAPLEQGFMEVADYAIEHNASVHMPRVGSGQSGGDWETVEEIVRDTLVARGIRVTVYDLPPRRQGPQAELFN